MPSLTVEFEVYCGKCGAGLCQQSEVRKGDWRSQPGINVDPCEKCLEEAKDEGDEEGYQRGQEEFEQE